ncbi:MAG: ATP synthase F0 subunit B [Acidobacteria bacterium]|nr:ATP synthase F0 subunit B [Acidobacteriota bacterium]
MRTAMSNATPTTFLRLMPAALAVAALLSFAPALQAQPADDHGAAAAHATDAHAPAGHGEEHGESVLVTLARLANFAILVGVIYWLARKPLADHLTARGAQIRKDLVDAAEMRTAATERLATIEARLAALPGELEDLRRRGAEELDAERTRIRTAAEVERDRLVDQARREIAAQTRHARTELRAEAAALIVDVADARLRATLTHAEQHALVDDYATRMRNLA